MAHEKTRHSREPWRLRNRKAEGFLLGKRLWQIAEFDASFRKPYSWRRLRGWALVRTEELFVGAGRCNPIDDDHWNQRLDLSDVDWMRRFGLIRFAVK